MVHLPVFHSSARLLPLYFVSSLFIHINECQCYSIPRELNFRWRARDTQQFAIPADNGGSQLTLVPDSGGQGEPINVIISATSDPAVLKNQSTDGGLINYFISIGFNTECLGQHLGSHQGANLGDGNGYLNETAVMRWDYGDPSLGTCKETLDGGNHFRYWIQNGKQANTGAIFMAVGYEGTAALDHPILLNGYDLGRDQLVGNATAQSVAPDTGSFALPPPPTPPLNITVINGTTSTSTPTPTTSSSPTPSATSPSVKIATFLPTFTGTTSANNYTYQTTTQYLIGLLQNSSTLVNHADSVAVPGGNAIDGLVALLEVKIIETPDGKKTSSAADSRFPSITRLWTRRRDSDYSSYRWQSNANVLSVSLYALLLMLYTLASA